MCLVYFACISHEIPKFLFQLFFSFHFSFLVFGDEVTKIRKYYVIFVYILQGKMGKTEKTGKKITQLK